MFTCLVLLNSSFIRLLECYLVDFFYWSAFWFLLLTVILPLSPLEFLRIKVDFVNLGDLAFLTGLKVVHLSLICFLRDVTFYGYYILSDLWITAEATRLFLIPFEVTFWLYSGYCFWANI